MLFKLILLAAALYFAYQIYKHIQVVDKKPLPSQEPKQPTMPKPQSDALQATITKADQAFQSESFHDARTYLERAQKIDPDNVSIYNKLGVVSQRLGDDDEAVRQFKKALEFEPNNELTHLALADILDERLKRYDDAKIHYERAIAIDDAFFEARYNYAGMLERIGDKKAAFHHYEKAQQIDPDHPDLSDALKRCE